MKNVYSVGQVNRYIKNMFDQDFMLRHIYVKGEVSNCKYHPSGHIYFSLKDESAAMACVMFAGNRGGLSFRLQDGCSVTVLGSVSVFERDGRYQMYASEIRQDGAGLLYEKFEALKRELEEMGMFAPEYKQPIPAYASRIGIVTAPTGAAIRDIQNIALRKNPYVELILYPALVQGKDAGKSIAQGIRMLDALGLDVLIVGRGGGSLEDLWAFNEEIVARAIFECGTPVISAVGHETDFTIADYVADLRAPTPSAAAELAAADVTALFAKLLQARQQLDRLMQAKLELLRARLEAYRSRMELLSPDGKIRDQRQILLGYEDRFCSLMDNRLKEARHAMLLYAERLKGLSPLDKLRQGYSWTADAAGRAVTGVSQVRRGQELSVYVSDGVIRASVTGTDAAGFEY